MSVERSAVNVERSAPRDAVFLSYASQAADVVQRMAEAPVRPGTEGLTGAQILLYYAVV